MKKTDLKVNNTLTEKSTAPEDIVEIEKLLQSGKIVVSGYIPDEFQIKKLIYSSDLKTLIKECKSAHFIKC